MRKVLIGFLAMGLCVLGLGAMWIVRADDADDDDTVKFTARLDGFQEVPAILSDGKGTLTLTLDRSLKKVDFELKYSDLTGVRQSHIHFGRVHTPGGFIVFFCTNLGNGPAGTQGCPPSPATVKGTIMGSDVVALATQNVSAGDFDAVTDALFSNSAYVNVHTTAFPAGEIRGQIRQEGRRRDRK
jgi:CHRD domain-containing protein